MIIARTPRRASWQASIRPVGPAPTIRTSVSMKLRARALHVVHRDRRARAADGDLARRAERELRGVAEDLAHRARDRDRLVGDAAQARREIHGLADDRVVEMVARAEVAAHDRP